jgi:hypothetical protein
MNLSNTIQEFVLPYIKRQLAQYEQLFFEYTNSPSFNSGDALVLLFLLKQQMKHEYYVYSTQRHLKRIYTNIYNLLAFNTPAFEQNIIQEDCDLFPLFNFCAPSRYMFSNNLNATPRTGTDDGDLHRFHTVVKLLNKKLIIPKTIKSTMRFESITLLLFNLWFETQLFQGTNETVQLLYSNIMYTAKQYSTEILTLMKQRTQLLSDEILISFGYLITHIALYENNYNIKNNINLIRSNSKMLRSSSSTIKIDIRSVIYLFCILFSEQLLNIVPCGHLDVLMECAALLLPSKQTNIHNLGVELLNHIIKLIVNHIEADIDNTYSNTLFTFAPNTSYCRAYMKLHFIHATLFACIEIEGQDQTN